MNPDREQFRKLARFLLNTRPDEMTCDEWLERIGEYADIVIAACPVPCSLEDVRQHIELCPECAEEFQAIVAALSDEKREG